MSEKRKEIVADILAEIWTYLREENPCGADDVRAPWINTDSIVCYLNRLDAALKREHGNAAKLREATEECLYHMRRNLAPYDEKDRRKIQASMERAKAGLSALPRNCDRFDTEDKARIAFLEYYWLIDCVDLKGQDRPEVWTDEMNREFAKWLYKTNVHLPAVEEMQEGGDK